jgi:hypothetical protein
VTVVERRQGCLDLLLENKKKTQKHRSRFLRTLQMFKKRLTPPEAKATASCPEPYDLLRSWIEGGETCPEL